METKLKPHEITKAKTCWSQLAATLNELPGANKSVKEWKDSLNEMKVNARRKPRLIINVGNKGTGGGPKTVKDLTDLEERILAFLSKVVITCLPGTTELGTAEEEEFQNDIYENQEILESMLITSSLLLDFLILLVVGVYALHLYVSSKFQYWKKRGIHAPEPKPLVGNFLDVALLKTTCAEWMKNYHDELKRPFFGVYIFDDPYLVVSDPKLIKNILIKDFQYFVDRNVAAPDHEPIIKHMLFMQKSPEWKGARSKLSVCFTSGKLKAMLPLVNKCADDLKKYLVRNQRVHEAKELAARFTTDVISKCAFGIESHSFEENESGFTVNRKHIFGFTIRNALSQTLYFFKPSWTEKFKFRFIQKSASDYFQTAFVKTMESRANSTTRYHDFVDIMNDIKKEDDKAKLSDAPYDWTFIGAAMQFFLAGFETTSATISFTLHECAMQPYIQKIAREEMETAIKKYGGVTYEAINDMPYLEMCINETLRKYPVLPFLERKCNEDYPIPGTDKVIGKGTPILVPMLGLHTDERYWSDPLKYDPERFRNKLDTSQGLYYLPFGDGPRNCLGERFGILGTKLALISVLTNFEVTPCSKTPDPVEFEPKSFLLQSKVGLPLRFTQLP